MKKSRFAFLDIWEPWMLVVLWFFVIATSIPALFTHLSDDPFVRFRFGVLWPVVSLGIMIPLTVAVVSRRRFLRRQGD